MNPIVKKLAEQAGFNVYEDGNFRVDPGQWINAELERFAELIVKKCAELAEECYCGDTVKWMLLTRFGVEP
jgi:hypothetical protein